MGMGRYADYVSPDMLIYKNITAKQWAGVTWFMDTLPDVDTGATEVADNLAWHADCLGHGINKEFETVWSYENTYSAHVAVSCVSSGAAVIDDNGVYLFKVDEDA